MTGYLVAWYFVYFIAGQEHPVLSIAHPSWEACTAAEEVKVIEGYETSDCWFMGIPVEITIE